MKARDIKGTKSEKIVRVRGNLLPKRVFVKWDFGNNEDPWLTSAEGVEELAEKGETVYIGEYRLVQVRKVELELKLRDV